MAAQRVDELEQQAARETVLEVRADVPVLEVEVHRALRDEHAQLGERGRAQHAVDDRDAVARREGERDAARHRGFIR